MLTLLPEPHAPVVQLEGGGAILWRLLDRPRTVPQLVGAICSPAGSDPAEFGQRERLTTEVKEAIGLLLDHGLVQRTAGDT